MSITGDLHANRLFRHYHYRLNRLFNLLSMFSIKSLAGNGGSKKNGEGGKNFMCLCILLCLGKYIIEEQKDPRCYLHQ